MAPTRGDKARCAAREGGRRATPQGGLGRSRSTSLESESESKQKQKAPESVRTSGIALRRLWALRFYNRAARVWFHPIRSWSRRLKGNPPPNWAGPTRHRTSMSTPGRDLLISTSGSRARRRSSIVTSRSRTPCQPLCRGRGGRILCYTAARRSLACRSGLRSLAARAPQNPLSRSR